MGIIKLLVSQEDLEPTRFVAQLTSWFQVLKKTLFVYVSLASVVMVDTLKNWLQLH